jgi:hypothetical protein
MSDRRILCRDANGHDAQSIISTKEACITEAADFELPLKIWVSPPSDDLAPRALRRRLFSNSRAEMNNARIDADSVDAAAPETIEGAVTFTVYFADREPIDGSLTVVDLTAKSCRWPTGNPRDLATFRYCGDTAHDSPYCKRHARLAYLPRLPRAA